jgi:hypothetical protein
LCEDIWHDLHQTCNNQTCNNAYALHDGPSYEKGTSHLDLLSLHEQNPEEYLRALWCNALTLPGNPQPDHRTLFCSCRCCTCSGQLLATRRRSSEVMAMSDWWQYVHPNLVMRFINKFRSHRSNTLCASGSHVCALALSLAPRSKSRRVSKTGPLFPRPTDMLSAASLRCSPT